MSSFLYLLDTDIISDLVRHPVGQVYQRIKKVGEEKVCTSIIVAAELRYGIRKKGSERLTMQVETILSGFNVLPLEPPSDKYYAELRVTLEKAGMPIGPNDMLIASQVMALDLILISARSLLVGNPVFFVVGSAGSPIVRC